MYFLVEIDNPLLKSHRSRCTTEKLKYLFNTLSDSHIKTKKRDYLLYTNCRKIFAKLFSKTTASSDRVN